MYPHGGSSFGLDESDILFKYPKLSLFVLICNVNNMHTRNES